MLHLGTEKSGPKEENNKHNTSTHPRKAVLASK